MGFQQSVIKRYPAVVNENHKSPFAHFGQPVLRRHFQTLKLQKCEKGIRTFPCVYARNHVDITRMVYGEPGDCAMPFIEAHGLNRLDIKLSLDENLSTGNYGQYPIICLLDDVE